MSRCSDPFLLTLPELVSAKRKIGKAAALYDRENQSLKGFTTRSLNPTEFRSQLHLNFAIELTHKELGAIVSYFDVDGNGTVDVATFISHFFKLGQEERSKIRKYNLDKAKKVAHLKETIRKEKEANVARLKKTRVTDKFTPEDEKRAIQKLAVAAFEYDPNKPAFKDIHLVKSVTVIEFSEIMKRNLLIYFTPAELASLLKLFDKDNSGKINCALFLQHFWNMGRMEHDKHLHDHMRIKHHKAQEEKKRKDNIKEKYGKLVEVRVKPCTEAERISAENKIKEVAAYFTREKAFPVSIDKCFEAEGLTPTQFKTLLSNNFKVVLTPGELDAVVHMFDTDGDGMISCVEFMTNFFRIGSNERTRVLIQHRVEDEKRLKTEQERRQKKIAAAQALATTKVIWPKFPEESTAPVVSESKRVGDDIETDDNTDAVPEKTPSPQRPLERKIRKPSVIELLSPDKFTHKLVQMQKRSLKKSKKKKGKNGVSSLTSLFPKASEQTKDFLLEIEEEERLIEKLRKKKSTTKRSVSAVGRSSNSVFSKDEPRQRPQSTSSSKFKNRIETAIKSNQKIENNTAQNASQEDFYEDYGEDEDHNESSMFGGEDYANEEFAL